MDNYCLNCKHLKFDPKQLILARLVPSTNHGVNYDDQRNNTQNPSITRHDINNFCNNPNNGILGIHIHMGIQISNDRLRT